MCRCIPDRIGIWKCRFLRRGENRSTQRKISQSKGENQQQTQPTCGVNTRIRTWATLVGGECPHHCDTFAPCSLNIISLRKKKNIKNTIQMQLQSHQALLPFGELPKRDLIFLRVKMIGNIVRYQSVLNVYRDVYNVYSTVLLTKWVQGFPSHGQFTGQVPQI